MRVDIIELLRCPAPHPPSPLVTVADARDGDRLIDGTLGCPSCLAEYTLRGGVVDLTTAQWASAERARHAASNATAPSDTLRLAALLGLDQPNLRVALCGEEALAAATLVALTDVQCVVINAPLPSHAMSGLNALRMTVGAQLPLASASLHALAVDAAHVALLADAARVVRTGGRVVAPAHSPVATGLHELARDSTHWVAEVRTAASRPIGLSRSR